MKSSPDLPARAARASRLLTALAVCGALLGTAASTSRAADRVVVAQASHINSVERHAEAPPPTLIAFGSRTGIFTMRMDGSHLRQVTTVKNGVDTQPAFSPSNRLIAYQRNIGTYPRDHSYLVVVNRATGGRHRLGRGDFAFPSWAPSGHRIAAVRLHRNRTRLVTIHGPAHTVQPLGASGRYQNEPAWTPDGRTILFSGKRTMSSEVSTAIMSISARDGTRQSVVFRGKRDSLSPSSSPDGEHIVFTQTSKVHPQHVPWSILAVVRSDGSHKRILLGGHVRAYRPAYTPDGRWVVFQRGTDGTAWAIHPSGKALHQISAVRVADPRPSN